MKPARTQLRSPMHASANIHCLPIAEYRRVAKMYPNPFDRKHSTIRQIIDRFIKVDHKLKTKTQLSRKSSNDSTMSNTSSKSSGSVYSYMNVVRSRS